MNELKKRLQQLSLRERRLLIGSGTLLIFCLGYYAFWHPWKLREEKWRNIITRERNTVEWMQLQAPRLKMKINSVQQDELLSLSATVTGSSSSYGVVITRLQPQGKQLSITMAPGEFNILMQWLTQLERQHHIHIVAFDVAAQDNKPGWVVVKRLILERN